VARILVVDDEPSAVELLAEFLATRGHTALIAGDGEAALRVLKEERPHIILLDYCMPEMDGLAVLRRVREIDREVGVIMVTAIHDAETGRAALQSGACDFVTKPIDFAYLDRILWHTLATMTL
jgi:DNA-binding response OmpR family regulator